jgi:hypothetical protein
MPASTSALSWAMAPAVEAGAMAPAMMKGVTSTA